MIELAVVIVIIGLLLAGGVAGWNSVLEGRRLAKTAAVLDEVKSCLARRAVLTERYPTYDTLTYPADGVSCTNAVNDLEICMCGKLDAWGLPLYFMEGVQSGGVGLAGKYIVNDPLSGRDKVSPGSVSTLINKKGNTIGDIAFVLFSLGRNRTADHSSYAGLNRVGLMPTAPNPDFDPANTDVAGIEYVDDVVLYITGNELVSTVSQ